MVSVDPPIFNTSLRLRLLVRATTVCSRKLGCVGLAWIQEAVELPKGHLACMAVLSGPATNDSRAHGCPRRADLSSGMNQRLSDGWPHQTEVSLSRPIRSIYPPPTSATPSCICTSSSSSISNDDIARSLTVAASEIGPSTRHSP